MHTDEEISKAFEVISEVCDSLKNKRRLEMVTFSLYTSYDTIRVLAIRDCIKYMSEEPLK